MYAVVNICGVDDDGELARIAEQLLEAVISNNRYLLRRFPGAYPLLYQSNVRFRAEPWAMPGGLKLPLELFDPIPRILERGWADCAQLCSWRVAELRELLGDSKARLRFYCRTRGAGPRRQRWYHVEVRRGNGDIEDPSRMLEY